MRRKPTRSLNLTSSMRFMSRVWRHPSWAMGLLTTTAEERCWAGLVFMPQEYLRRFMWEMTWAWVRSKQWLRGFCNWWMRIPMTMNECVFSPETSSNSKLYRWYGFRSWFDITGRGSVYLSGTALKLRSLNKFSGLHEKPMEADLLMNQKCGHHW